MQSLPGEREKNLEKARQMVLSANPVPKSLILFPEMFATGYIPERAKELAENFEKEDGPTAQMLKQLAQETGCFVLGGGMHREGNGFTNRTCLYAPAKATSRQPYYDKVHPFFPEQKDFTAGKEITLFKIQDVTVATSICYDLRFPELYREAHTKGAQALTVQASWPAVRNEHWETLLRARAIENQAYVIAVNNVSADGTYVGNSQVIAPDGECIAKANAGKEQVISAEISAEFVEKYRSDFPVR
jgi:predicted amidohydrolase